MLSQDVTMACLWCAPATENLPFKRRHAAHQMWLAEQPSLVFHDHFFPSAVTADDEWVAPWPRPADVHVTRLSLAMDDAGSQWLPPSFDSE
jgi:hypothetical protein